MKITQTYLAKTLDVSKAFINRVVMAKQRPNWDRAKQLSKITNTDPTLWLEGTEEEIKKAIQNISEKPAA